MKDICIVCDKEVTDMDDYDFFGMDGDRIHTKCKPNLQKKLSMIDNMSGKVFHDWMTSKDDK